ncbi:hypothetical protein BDZ94DRAFT_1297476 [Collybia nuda]|uniref:Uncharacterized protein n=1 Tax=Collybia nuda TaxID=64659 RepID=A0A9P5Y8D2_9AGAR|nr:hypothetical protein BDZ94DRAFT_1297476 [Collybia nuda]
MKEFSHKGRHRSHMSLRFLSTAPLAAFFHPDSLLMSVIWSRGVERPLVSQNIIAFDVLASLGIVSVTAVFVPAVFSPRIRRSATWFGMLTSWLVYSLSYVLLFGRQFSMKFPPHGLCMLQAILVYVMPPLCSVATTCFTIDFFLKISKVKIQGKKIGYKTGKFIIALPWASGLVIAIEAILVINDDTAVTLDPNHFYCHITNSIPTMVNIGILCLCSLIVIPLEIYTGILLYRNWAVIKNSNGKNAHVALSTLVRLILFSFIVSLAIALTLFTATHLGKFVAAWGIVLVTLPIFSAICFGTQQDLLNVWLFWRRPSSSKGSDIDGQRPKDVEG